MDSAAGLSGRWEHMSRFTAVVVVADATKGFSWMIWPKADQLALANLERPSQNVAHKSVVQPESKA